MRRCGDAEMRSRTHLGQLQLSRLQLRIVESGSWVRASKELSRLQLRIRVKCPCGSDSGSGLRLDTPMMALHGKNEVESIHLILGLLQSFSEIDAAPAFNRKTAVVYLNVIYKVSGTGNNVLRNNPSAQARLSLGDGYLSARVYLRVYFCNGA